MKIRIISQLALFGLLILIVTSIMSAMAATNTVPKTGIDDVSRSITANDLKPAQCNGIHITNLIATTGIISGTAGNDLILGGPGVDTISGEGGDDCILGGAGNDTITGGSGNDICLGGSGTNTIDASCETQQ